MKNFFKKATTLLISFSSIGFVVVLYLCVVNHPVLRVMLIDSISLDVYLTIMASCFIAVFLASVCHTLYLREKLYESQW
jgi:hypothetical protein